MTVLGIKRRLVHLLVNHVFCGTKYFALKRQLLLFAGYRIGEGTKIVGPFHCTGEFTTGKDCWIGRDLWIHGNGSVILGDRCDLGPGVMFLTGGHTIGGEDRRAGAGTTHTIRVEDGCWLGARTTLANSITLGRGSVLAACGCAVRDIPPNTLAGGVPASPIRSLYET